ncbi:MAG TPA: condensation domain-containing protein, partial [Pyrinomonadaceae bacterium]|nr:condensation domain-containing protein [Pyrinomonadaceae bacterium]
KLNITALERALTELVRRHEALRTTFRDLHGEPVQVIGKPNPFTVSVEDLSGLPEATRDEEARRLILEEVLRPFNLSTEPLMRARLLRLSTDEHVLLLSLHHTVSDGWSMGVLVREVATLYEAYAVGAESPLKELNLQYGDYAVWQREWLRGEVLDQQLAYWRKQLAGAPPVLELPADRSRPQVQTFRGAALPFKLSKELTEELRALSRREGVTLYMTLLAGLQTLLARYTGQEDISTGTPIANRRRGELENLIGFFVNTLVLRTDLSGNPTFHELVQRVKETALGAYAHQDVPFEMLVEVLQPERSMSYTPLFQVLFVLQNAPQEKLELSGLTVELLDIGSGTAKFDLVLSLEESENGLEGSCEYSTDLFDEGTIRRLLGHFETLLEGAVNNPDEHVAQLPLLPQAERRQLLNEWNATAERYPSDLCVHELFAQQAEQTPGDVAVIFEATHLDYRELNERAN